MNWKVNAGQLHRPITPPTASLRFESPRGLSQIVKAELEFKTPYSSSSRWPW